MSQTISGDRKKSRSHYHDGRKAFRGLTGLQLQESTPIELIVLIRFTHNNPREALPEIGQIASDLTKVDSVERLKAEIRSLPEVVGELQEFYDVCVDQDLLTAIFSFTDHLGMRHELPLASYSTSPVVASWLRTIRDNSTPFHGPCECDSILKQNTPCVGNPHYTAHTPLIDIVLKMSKLPAHTARLVLKLDTAKTYLNGATASIACMETARQAATREATRLQQIIDSETPGSALLMAREELACKEEQFAQAIITRQEREIVQWSDENTHGREMSRYLVEKQHILERCEEALDNRETDLARREALSKLCEKNVNECEELVDERDAFLDEREARLVKRAEFLRERIAEATAIDEAEEEHRARTAAVGADHETSTKEELVNEIAALHIRMQELEEELAKLTRGRRLTRR